MSSLIGKGLTKRYGSREVVRSVDLEVRPAQVVGLLGPNGAGKTTTFNMMAGGVRPSGGQVFLGQSEITDLPMYRRARLGIQLFHEIEPTPHPRTQTTTRRVLLARPPPPLEEDGT